MEKELVIKALECCTTINVNVKNCGECPLRYENCTIELPNACLSLIKELAEDNEWSAKRIIEADKKVAELTEEKVELWNERNRIYNDLQDWKAIAEGYQKQFEDCAEDRAKLTEENERLINDRGALCSHLVCAETEKTIIIADTVREMKERLDKHFCHDPAFLGVEQRLIMDVIDQNAKEMIENG